MKVLVGYNHLYKDQEGDVYTLSSSVILLVENIDSLTSSFTRFVESEKTLWSMVLPQASMKWFLPQFHPAKKGLKDELYNMQRKQMG